MIKYKKIKVGKRYIEALLFSLSDKNLIVLKGRNGYIMCGYLNLKAARKFKDAAAMITGVSTIAGALKAEISAVTPGAAKIGMHKNQPVKEALKIIA